MSPTLLFHLSYIIFHLALYSFPFPIATLTISKFLFYHYHILGGVALPAAKGHKKIQNVPGAGGAAEKSKIRIVVFDGKHAAPKAPGKKIVLTPPENEEFPGSGPLRQSRNRAKPPTKLQLFLGALRAPIFVFFTEGTPQRNSRRASRADFAIFPLREFLGVHFPPGALRAPEL